jgi:hypothetical protein
MTVAYGCHQLGLAEAKPTVCVWIVGACFEVDQPWLELLAWLPAVVTLQLVFLGPDVGQPDYSQPGAPSITQEDSAATATIEHRPVPASLTIDGVQAKLEYHRLCGIYHWLSAEQRASLPAPDLAIALNSGMIEYDAGMLTQGGQGGRPAPLASRFHSISIHFPLNLHGIWWKLQLYLRCTCLCPPPPPG